MIESIAQSMTQVLVRPVDGSAEHVALNVGSLAFAGHAPYGSKPPRTIEMVCKKDAAWKQAMTWTTPTWHIGIVLPRNCHRLLFKGALWCVTESGPDVLDVEIATDGDPVYFD